MSKNLSAIKKNKVILRNRYRNKMYKSSIKTLTKKYLLSLENKEIDNTILLMYISNIYQKIDKAIKRGVLHKSNGAHKKAALIRAMRNSISQK